MELSADSKLLRVFVGEIDKIDHQPLYEAILLAAKKEGLAGCTVLRGIMSYGASSRVHTSKLIEISEDLPIIIEIVDEEDRITAFVQKIDQLLDQAGCGGLITIEKAAVLQYKPKKKKADTGE
jgi:PII-like signaling protein